MSEEYDKMRAFKTRKMEEDRQKIAEPYKAKIARLEKGLQWMLDAATDFEDMKCKARILLADREIQTAEN